MYLTFWEKAGAKKISGKSFHYLSAVSKWINTRTFPFRRQLGPIYDKSQINTYAKYKNFGDFLNAAGI